ncbi:hypothetical protein PMAYCL1PPCAC_00275, partial [Pristionchus mayeri]
FTASLVLLALFAAVAFIEHAEACAPAAGGGDATTQKPAATSGRKKRSIENDVQVAVVSTEPFDLAHNEINMEKVDQKLKQFAAKEGLSFSALQNVPRASENVG